MTAPKEHPRYGKPLSGRPIEVAGTIFRPYRRGTLAYVRCDDAFRIEVYRPSHANTYRAYVDGVSLGKKFRVERRAFEAAVAQAKEIKL